MEEFKIMLDDKSFLKSEMLRTINLIRTRSGNDMNDPCDWLVKLVEETFKEATP